MMTHQRQPAVGQHFTNNTAKTSTVESESASSTSNSVVLKATDSDLCSSDVTISISKKLISISSKGGKKSSKAAASSKNRQPMLSTYNEKLEGIERLNAGHDARRKSKVRGSLYDDRGNLNLGVDTATDATVTVESSANGMNDYAVIKNANRKSAKKSTVYKSLI